MKPTVGICAVCGKTFPSPPNPQPLPRGSVGHRFSYLENRDGRVTRQSTFLNLQKFCSEPQLHGRIMPYDLLDAGVAVDHCAGAVPVLLPDL